LYIKHFKKDGITTRVGYIGGDVGNPTYRQVCGGDTNHAEALEITFDPSKVSYATLTEFFYRMHDPTTLNHQGPDRGTQCKKARLFMDDSRGILTQLSIYMRRPIGYILPLRRAKADS
jgi:peptide-methionine (S)-S-oxide reductase